MNIKKLSVHVLIFILVSVLFNCGKEDKKSLPNIPANNENKNEVIRKFQYSFVEEGKCHTGKHEFLSDTEEDLNRQICEELRKDQDNQYCALDERHELFQDRCVSKKYNWFRKYSSF